MEQEIELVSLQPDEKKAFIAALQKSFALTPTRLFGQQTADVIAHEEADEAITVEGAETYNIVCEGEVVGGVAVRIDSQTDINSLDLLFIKHKFNNLGLGFQVWRAIEQRYPQTKKWITVTPYYDQRNIHFYVNKCGFKIVEFFNPKHWDDAVPQQDIPDFACYFRFEKEMESAPKA